jgi:hypothetical protein
LDAAIIFEPTTATIRKLKFTTGDAEYTWGEVYIIIMQNLKRLRDYAEANENHSYGVIGKVLTAYT